MNPYLTHNEPNRGYKTDMTKRPVEKKRAYDNRRYRRHRITVLRRDGYRCQWCGKDIAGRDATIDHIIPISSGEIIEDISNLMSACRSCNSSRGNRGQPNKQRKRPFFSAVSTPAAMTGPSLSPGKALWTLIAAKKGNRNDAN